MSRYHVDIPVKLALVQVALDQSFGLRDVAGNPTPRQRVIYKAGAMGPALAMGSPQEIDLPGTNWPLIDGGDGTAALFIADAPTIDAKLGRTVNGVALPRVADLVQVARPRDSSVLPPGVRDKVDDAWIDVQLDGTDINGQPRDTPAARAAVRAELQGQATAALARKDARKAQRALDVAIGHGKAG